MSTDGTIPQVQQAPEGDEGMVVNALPRDDDGGGGDPYPIPESPPRVNVSITSAVQDPTYVGPNKQAAIRVSGTVSVTEGTELSSHSTTVTVTVGSTMVTAAIGADGRWSASVNRVVAASGSIDVSAKALTSFTYMMSGKSGSVSKTVTGSAALRVDSVPPHPNARPAGDISEFACPMPGGTLTVTVMGMATDSDSGVASVAVGTSPGSLTSFVPSDPSAWSRSVILPATVGTHTVYVRATDNVGNQSQLYTVPFTLVDRTPPELTVEAIPRMIYDDRPLALAVRGTVLDAHTGVQGVQVALRTAAGQAVGSPVAASPGTAAPGQRVTWNASLTLPSAGEYQVHVTATDLAGRTAVVTADVHAPPIPAPALDILSPVDGEVIPGTDDGADVVVRGTAAAPLTTLTKVEVSVGGATFVQARNDSGDWTRWSADVHVPADGEQDIVARATTAALNPQVNRKTDTVRVSVGVRYTARDTEDNTSLVAYYHDLLKFATRRVRITEGTAVRALTREELAGQLHQPFDRLESDEPVSQARLCVEVLRGYAAAIGRSPSPEALAAYREAAYRALLVQFGTSYEELRRLRGGAQRDREALAERLGIGADLATLDALLLSPEGITEEALESVFRLESTARDPLAGTPQARLFRAMSAHLRTVWLREDHEDAGLPALIDPDVVSEANIPASKRSPSNLPYALWSARRSWVAGKLDELAADRVAGENDQARLVRLLEKTAASTTMAQLQALEADRAAGRDIDAGLAAHGLTPASFDFLVRMHDAAGRGPLLSSEWADVYSLLAQLAKLRVRAQWRSEEATVVVGPDDFVPAAGMPPLPAWRATASDWREWQEKLRARFGQEDALIRAYDDAVAAAEATALPILRDALVAAVAPAPPADEDEMRAVANWLTQRLMIDVQASSTLRTTRMTQAVETLQGILGALRAGRFMEMELEVAPLPPGEWTLTVPDAGPAGVDATFDAEWVWMGTYTSWRAAMRVFLYPENLLVPGLRHDVTPEFRAMMEAREAGPLSTEDARRLADAYRAAVDANAAVSTGLNALVSGWGGGVWKQRSHLLDERIAESDLKARAAAVRQLMQANAGQEPVRVYLEELFFWVPVQLALLLHQAGQHAAALDWFRTVYGYNLRSGERKVYHGLVEEEQYPCVYQTTDQWLRTSLNPHDIAPQRAGALTRFALLSIARSFLDFADAEFAADGGESGARARTLYLAALELLNSADMRLPGDGEDPALAFGFAANPEAQALRMHAELNLLKLRSGRNIAGMQRQGAAAGRAAGTQAGAPQPTPYRYASLIDRAKQLVGLAQQMEAQYLAALEKRDAETYSLIKARHDLGLTQATVQLQDLRIGEAAGGVNLATLQQSRARVQRDTYQGWIDAGEIRAERDLLQNYRDANRYRNWATGLDAAATVAQAITSASSGGIFGTGIGAGWSGVAVTAAVATARAGVGVALNNVETRAQINSLTASFERRRQEWELQAALSAKDEAIGMEQVVQARQHLRIAGQELTIAQMQAGNAAATVEFLASKFTSAELYEWMSGVLGRVYAYFLQQATAIARLAEGQLAFERQEKPVALIRADYWQTPVEADTAGSADGGAKDRRGMTGSARLLQDIYQLDQYAFETNKRKLQLSRTISLAQLAPFEMERFRRTGTLVFATPMEMFDRDFPGQYLRLVRRVRTSVIALVPPTQGIRATLSASGMSRVTVADGGYQTLTLRRDPELVALTSPASATGLFELDVQSELLLPFEGMGVDTTWTLDMPRASNPFDFSTIADVLLTVEYTALHSHDYRHQVIRTLDTRFSAEKGVSFRELFPDAWYELSNSAPSMEATVTFDLARDHFPPNLEDLRVESLLLHFAPRNGAPVEARVSDLRFPALDTAAGAPVVVSRSAGSAEAVEGVVSTRRNHWRPVVGARLVAGQWSLTVDAATAARIRGGEVEDLLLVIGYGANTPAWT